MYCGLISQPFLGTNAVSLTFLAFLKKNFELRLQGLVEVFYYRLTRWKYAKKKKKKKK